MFLNFWYNILWFHYSFSYRIPFKSETVHTSCCAFPPESWVKLLLVQSTSWASEHLIIFTCFHPPSACLLSLPLCPCLCLLGKCFLFLIWLSAIKTSSFSCALCCISAPHLEPCWCCPCSLHLCLLASLPMAML